MSIFTNKQIIVKLPLLATCAAWLSVTEAADLYQVVDLGELGEVASDTFIRSAESFAINNADNIVGNANGEGFASHAFIYQNNSLSDLGHLQHSILNVEVPTRAIDGAGISFAFGMNDEYSVGYSIESVVTEGEDDTVADRVDNAEMAVFYNNSTLTINKIPQFSLDTPRNARAISINDNNLVVGYELVDPDDGDDDNGDPFTTLYRRGFFYNIDTESLVMVNPLEGENAQRNILLRAVNNAGLAVGVSEQLIDQEGSLEVVIVDVNTPETVMSLEIFGGQTQQPWDINNAGKIVGTARFANSTTITEAFLYETDSDSVTSLGFLNENFKDSEAFDINEVDQIVGWSQVQNSPIRFHAFLHENDSIRDLNKLISCEDASAWELTEARSINDSGIITGTGVFEGEKRAFMLRPLVGSAPECVEESSGSSGSIPVAGLLLLTLVGLRQRKK